MKYKGLLFDMDGTLMDSEHLHIKAWINILKQVGIHTTPDYFQKWIGVSDVELMPIILSEFGFGHYDSLDLVEQKRAFFRQYAREELHTIPGIKEGLEALKNWPMALVTMSSKKNALLSIELTKISHYFKTVITLNDVLIPKPDPECYLKASSILGFHANECIAIEDSESGVKSAKSAGCFTIGVANTIEASRLGMADVVFEDSGVVMEYLKEMSNRLQPKHQS